MKKMKMMILMLKKAVYVCTICDDYMFCVEKRIGPIILKLQKWFFGIALIANREVGLVGLVVVQQSAIFVQLFELQRGNCRVL